MADGPDSKAATQASDSTPKQAKLDKQEMSKSVHVAKSSASLNKKPQFSPGLHAARRINANKTVDSREAEKPKGEKGEKLPSAANIKPGSFVIQKYIEVPLLIDRRKFDIRVWVLVTHEGRVYFFKEGYIRMSSEEYNLN